MKTDSKRYLELAKQKRDAAARADGAALRDEMIELAIAYEKLAELANRIAQLRSGAVTRLRP